jgi:hypothetical protein
MALPSHGNGNDCARCDAVFVVDAWRSVLGATWELEGMRFDAPFVVKRLAPTIGRPGVGRRITIAHRAYSLAEALDYAREPARRRRALMATVAREGLGGDTWQARSIRELERTATWIERRGTSASITQARRREEGRGA